MTTPIHPRYGVKVCNKQLNSISANNGYAEIRNLFEQYSFLYFPDQELSNSQHLQLGALFGPREDRTIDKMNPDPAVSLVSNVKPGGELVKQGDKKLLDLQSNMLWHTDSTFLPIPALANILVGRVIPQSGTSTEFASTRAAWKDMPESLRLRARHKFLIHDYAHSRRKIDPQLATEKRFTHWGRQTWKSVWRNPLNGEEALYIASHASGVVGMVDENAIELIDELLAWCTRDKYIYAHQWQKNDVLIWDERAILHRGVPWNYAEERTLSSICISAQPSDGLEDMRYCGDSV